MVFALRCSKTVKRSQYSMGRPKVLVVSQPNRIMHLRSVTLLFHVPSVLSCSPFTVCRADLVYTPAHSRRYMSHIFMDFHFYFFLNSFHFPLIFNVVKSINHQPLSCWCKSVFWERLTITKAKILWNICSWAMNLFK